MSEDTPAAPLPRPDADAFRAAGHAFIDWLADYRERVADLPVMSTLEPGDVRAQLPATAPETGEDFDAILADLDRIIVPGLMHWQSPNFYGYFPANSSPPSVFGELVSAGLGVQGMLWQTSPACTELETHVLDWLVELLDLPPRFASSGRGGGVIQDSASSATLCALLAARERASAYTAVEAGCDPRITAYCSPQTHSSMDKAASIAGLGRERLRKVGAANSLVLDADALDRAIEADRAAGLLPAFVCATVGTTSSLDVDPVADIGAVCARHGVWLHVDAAMAGSAAICPEYRWLNDGLELADSYCFNPHKWLLTNFDCDCFFVADREALLRALSVNPAYLSNDTSDAGAAIDYRDWQVPLGRRFRALKLWFVLRWYGAAALRAFIRHHVGLAQGFADRVVADDRFELVVPRRLNLVCFRYRGDDRHNRRLMDELNRGGRLFLSHTVLDGRVCLRFCVGQSDTREAHVDAAWREIERVASTLEST